MYWIPPRITWSIPLRPTILAAWLSVVRCNRVSAGIRPNCRNIPISLKMLSDRGFECENHLIGGKWTPHPFLSNFFPLCFPVGRKIMHFHQRRILIEDVPDPDKLVSGSVVLVMIPT